MQNETPFIEANILLAFIAEDDERAEELLKIMKPGELMALRDTLRHMDRYITGVLVKPVTPAKEIT